MVLEELQVIVSASIKPMQDKLKVVEAQLKGLQSSTSKSMDGLQKSVNKATSGVAKAGKTLKAALVALGLGKVLKDGFNLARTYESSVQQVNRLFGLYSGALENWVQKNAKTFGMARADAMKYASVYGNLVRAFEKDGSRMTQYTTDLMKATSIIASNTGRTVADVSERIRSGILGNTEAIEDLGIYSQVAMLKTTNAFKEVANGRTWDKLTFQEQQQIRVLSILEQTSSQFGDSIQNNMNYQLMQLTATLKNIALNLGQAFMPIVSVVVPILNTMANALEIVTAKLANFMNTLFGTNFDAGAGVNASTSQGFTNMGSEATKAGEEAEKAGKKAKGALMGFDEVNTLNPAKDGGGPSDGVGATGGIVETISPVESTLDKAATTFADKLKAELERLTGLFQEGFEIGIGGDWKERLEELQGFIPRIKESLSGIFDSETINAAKNALDSFILSFGEILGVDASVGMTIGTNLLGGLSSYLEENKEYIKSRIIGILDVGAETTLIFSGLVTTIADIFSVFGGETGQGITSNIIGIFSNGYLGIMELSLTFAKDFLSVIADTISNNAEGIKIALENTLKPLETSTSAIKDLVTNTFKKVFEVYEQYISPAYKNMQEGFDKVVKAFLNAYNTYLAPSIDKMAKKWSEFYSNTLQPVINKAIEVLGKLGLASSELYKNVFAPFVVWIIDVMGPRISFVFETISEAFLIIATAITEQVGNLLTIFGGFIDFISGVFSGDWDKAWDGIKTMFKATTDSFETLIKDPINKGLEWIKTTFTSGWGLAWDGVSKVFKGVFDGLVLIAKGPINIIIEAINTMIRGLNKFKIEIPDWVGDIPGLGKYGGQSIGFKIPTIPKLARGGIVDGATFMGNYIAGEAGKEMIVPLENTSFVDKLATSLGNAVSMAMQFNNRGSSEQTPTEAVFEIDGWQIAKAIIPPLQKELRRTGIRLDSR